MANEQLGANASSLDEFRARILSRAAAVDAETALDLANGCIIHSPVLQPSQPASQPGSGPPSRAPSTPGSWFGSHMKGRWSSHDSSGTASPAGSSNSLPRSRHPSTDVSFTAVSAASGSPCMPEGRRRSHGLLSSALGALIPDGIRSRSGSKVSLPPDALAPAAHASVLGGHVATPTRTRSRGVSFKTADGGNAWSSKGSSKGSSPHVPPMPKRGEPHAPPSPWARLRVGRRATIAMGEAASIWQAQQILLRQRLLRHASRLNVRAGEPSGESALAAEHDPSRPMHDPAYLDPAHLEQTARDAVRMTRDIAFPAAFVSAVDFMKAGAMVEHEKLREGSRHIFRETLEQIAASPARVVFISHQVISLHHHHHHSW